MNALKIKTKLTKVNFKKGGNTKKYIVIHDVGVPGQTAYNNIQYFYNVFRGASAHYFVDKANVWRSVNDDNIAWHVGDGKSKYGITNSNSIGIEMIVEKGGFIHEQTKQLTKQLVKKLQKKYNIPDKNIVRHYDASRKNCPQFMNKDKKWTEWNEFYKYLTSAEHPQKGDDETLKFTDSYLEKQARERIKSAVDGKTIDGKWLKAFDNKTLTASDYVVLNEIIKERSKNP